MGHCLGGPKWPRLNSHVMIYILAEIPALGTAHGIEPAQVTEIEAGNAELAFTRHPIKLFRICKYFCHGPNNKMS